MPRIQSRLHADELLTTKQALAAAVKDVQALHECVDRQQKELDAAAIESASLSQTLAEAQADLHTAHTMLGEVQAHFEGRERRLQDRVRRLEDDVRTLEEMVQAARRREAATALSSSTVEGGTPVKQHCVPPSPCKACAKLREELRRVREATRAESPPLAPSAAPSRPPRPPPDAPPSSSSLPPAAGSASPSSARSSYWQDQLLSTTQQAAACFDVVRRHTHDICSRLGAGDPAGEGVGSLGGAAAAWATQLSHLQQNVDDVVQADAKVISFLVLVAEQQSGEIQRLQRRWAAAQDTVREAESVMDEAQRSMDTQARETELLRAECTALTEGQRRCSAQLAAQTRELQVSHAALSVARAEQQRQAEDHTRAIAALHGELAQCRELQQRATTYAGHLEAALQDKQRLLESAATARHARQEQEVLAATRSRVAQFVTQLSHSAQQLQTSLSSPDATHLPVEATASVVYGHARPKAAASISSPEPSPPGATASSSPSPRRTARSLSSLPYDDSLFLGDVTLPFAA